MPGGFEERADGVACGVGFGNAPSTSCGGGGGGGEGKPDGVGEVIGSGVSACLRCFWILS